MRTLLRAKKQFQENFPYGDWPISAIDLFIPRVTIEASRLGSRMKVNTTDHQRENINVLCSNPLEITKSQVLLASGSLQMMDSSYSFPGSPGTPLIQASPERVNQQRPSMLDSSTSDIRNQAHSRDSSVHEKVAAFNTLAFQGKQLERKANDAALKRAMLGREEAESEMRKYREDSRALRRQVEEGRERERRVGERLESVMENYGRAKETHAHTQTLWEKEIRRARKESFKSQSVVVKLQEELKSTRNAMKAAQANWEAEKERSEKREEEAFAARYQLVGTQEELLQMQEKIKLVEQERDALRTVVRNDEVARIAAEGQLPLPQSSPDDEFASPKKNSKFSNSAMIVRSAASEEELDDIKLKLEWEERRAKRAYNQIEFLEMECRFNCCTAKSSQADEISVEAPVAKKLKIEHPIPVFIPAEGVFQNVSPSSEDSPLISPAAKNMPTSISTQPLNEQSDQVFFARTPSCEPPATALVPETNTSLLSLLDAPTSPSQPEDSPELIVEQESPVRTFHTVSTTTRIPLANAPDLTPLTTLPTNNDPALSPTMSREEALAKIRERRGRARSLAQGTLTPRKQMVEGGPVRRDISAPAVRSANARGKSQARAQ